MSRTTVRSFAVAAGVLAASLAAAPAFAATAPTTKPTSLTIKAAKSTVARNQKDTLTGTLKSGKKVLAGETVKLEKRAAGAKHFTVVATKTTTAKGQVTLVVTPGTKKGQKEQYELVFSGTKSYKASHSSIITVTVS
jgi:hypothetical protein